MNNPDLLQNCINKTKVNRVGGYLTHGKSYSPKRLAECIDKFNDFHKNYRRPTVKEFIAASKIGSSYMGSNCGDIINII